MFLIYVCWMNMSKMNDDFMWYMTFMYIFSVLKRQLKCWETLCPKVQVLVGTVLWVGATHTPQNAFLAEELKRKYASVNMNETFKRQGNKQRGFHMAPWKIWNWKEWANKREKEILFIREKEKPELLFLHSFLKLHSFMSKTECWP